MADAAPRITTTELNRALIDTLSPTGPLFPVFVEELQKALPWVDAQAARYIARDMLATRQRKEIDGTGTAIAHLGLPAHEIEEIAEGLVQQRKAVGDMTADALVHIYANLHAQYELHATLCDSIFYPRGRVEQVIVQNLVERLPGLSEQSAKEAAADFVQKLRIHLQDEAKALEKGGPVEQKAIALARELRGVPAEPMAEEMPQTLWKMLADKIKGAVLSIGEMLSLRRAPSSQAPAEATPVVTTTRQEPTENTIALLPEPKERVWTQSLNTQAPQQTGNTIGMR
jgi:hypothetical protein